MNTLKRVLPYGYMAIYATFWAFAFRILITPNSFAPGGVDGICTMIEHLFDINLGYLSLLVNFPLFIAAWLIVKRDFTIKTGIYVLFFSLGSIIFEQMDLSAIAFYTENGSSTVLAPLAAGVIRGILYALTLKHNGSSGGIDIIAKIIHKYKPHHNMMHILFAMNCAIAFASYFVFGFRLEPVLCNIIFSFVTTTTTQNIQMRGRETVKFEIITADAEELCKRIEAELHQTSTTVTAQGSYSHTDKKMVICVTKKQNVPKLETIVADFPDAVTFESVISHSIYAHQ